jgi:hypothetical protein
MALTDTAIRNAKPADKPRKLSDGGGLHLLVMPTGGKWWRVSYRYFSKQKTLSLGTYPEVSLAMARERLIETKKLLASGRDPSVQAKLAKITRSIAAANTFNVVADEYLAKFEGEGTLCLLAVFGLGFSRICSRTLMPPSVAVHSHKICWYFCWHFAALA